MFWGLIMEPNKRYTQTVEKPFHVSMATLDVSTADDEIVQVMLCYDGRNYLLCNLKKGHTWQVPLDLNFQEGTKIAFTSNGRGHVHLTGYLVPDEDIDELEEEEDDEEEEEEIPELVGKRKAKASPTDGKAAKRLKETVKEIAEVEEDSSEDEDSPLDGIQAESDDDGGDEDDEEDADEEAEDEEEDDDDDDDDDEEEEESEEEVEPVKPQKKGKQKKSQQQEQPQKLQKNKKEEKQQPKQALVNGKDKKADKKNKENQNDSTVQRKRVITGGVQVEELKVGNGAPAKPGRFVSVYYIGKLPNGKKFDATTQGDGFKFRLGKGEVIKGWDVGVQGMKVGGKRRLTIPANMGYGVKGSPPVIPGNSTLIFEVELKQVH